MFGFVLGVALSSLGWMCYKQFTEYRRKTEKSESLIKMHEFYLLLVYWIKSYLQGKTVGKYLESCSINTVAIYGMKELGEILYEELKNSPVTVAYIIDKDADTIFSDIAIVKPGEKLDTVDAVIVTAIHYYDEIKDELSRKMTCPVLSLKDVIGQ